MKSPMFSRYIFVSPWTWSYKIIISLSLTDLTDNWTVFPIRLQQLAGVVLYKLGWKSGEEGTCHSSSLGWKCKIKPKARKTSLHIVTSYLRPPIFYWVPSCIKYTDRVQEVWTAPSKPSQEWCLCLALSLLHGCSSFHLISEMEFLSFHPLQILGQTDF